MRLHLVWYSHLKLLMRCTLNGLELARDVVNILEEKIGEDILLLDVREIASFTDYFVFCTGTSDRMLDALQSALRDGISKKHHRKGKAEGSGRFGWVVMDFGEVVVHMLSPEQRSYYKLEQIWEAGKVILRLQ